MVIKLRNKKFHNKSNKFFWLKFIFNPSIMLNSQFYSPISKSRHIVQPSLDHPWLNVEYDVDHGVVISWIMSFTTSARNGRFEEVMVVLIKWDDINKVHNNTIRIFRLKIILD